MYCLIKLYKHVMPKEKKSLDSKNHSNMAMELTQNCVKELLRKNDDLKLFFLWEGSRGRGRVQNLVPLSHKALG